jgi:hypothetical protein
MSEPLEAKRPATAVKCEKHGLHYNPSTMDGCVICRREAGGGTRTAAASAPSGSMGQALAVTAVLLVLTTACLYFVHGMVIETFQGVPKVNALDGGFEEPIGEMMPETTEEDMTFPEEDDGGPVYSGSEGN